MQWRRASEIVAGLVLDAKLSAESVDVSILESPYDIAVRMAQEGSAESAMLDSVGIHALDIAHKAAAASRGDPYKYLEACESASARVHAGSILRPLVDK